jgi:predicted transposase YbfD/YdcC
MFSVYHSKEEFEENNMKMIMLAALGCKFCVRTKKHEIQNYIHKLQERSNKKFPERWSQAVQRSHFRLTPGNHFINYFK